MEHGKIKEMGTHAELMAKGETGLYYNLVLAQQLNETTEAANGDELNGTKDESDEDTEEEMNKVSELGVLPRAAAARKMSQQPSVRQRKGSHRTTSITTESDYSDIGAGGDSALVRRRAYSRMLRLWHHINDIMYL